MLDLSVVIPSLNAAGSLGATLAALPVGLEVIVVDGGSSDATIEIARASGARVVSAPRGRGLQLRHGALNARASWLLFLHADTVLAPGWIDAARSFVAEPGNQKRAASFRLALDDAGLVARWLERTVAWRTRVLGLPYGDQGLLISRAFYESLGGYQPLPIMEDVDLVRRIGRRRLTMLDVPARTSAVRYRQGYLVRSSRNLCCLALYYLGVPPEFIAWLYEGRRRP